MKKKVSSLARRYSDAVNESNRLASDNFQLTQIIDTLKKELASREKEISRLRYTAVNSWISSVAQLNTAIANAIGEGIERPGNKI